MLRRAQIELPGIGVMSRRLAAALTLLAVGLSPSVAGAQGPISVGFAAGPSSPVGDLADDVNVGWRALGTVALGLPVVPIGVRLDLAYDRLSFQRALAGSSGDAGSLAMTSATANLTLRLPLPGLPLTPYLIGGAGAYRTNCSPEARCESSTRAGGNAGLGVNARVLGRLLFLEARVHGTGSSDAVWFFVPVTLGLRI